MITITIKQDLDLEKTTFEDVAEVLTLLAGLDSDYEDPDFEDTIVTPALIKQAEQARQTLKDNPGAFIKSSA